MTPVQPSGADSPSRVRWENRIAGRYYEAVLQRDLFGGLEVCKCWGGIGSRRGGEQRTPAVDAAAGQAELVAVAARRLQRGYARVRGSVG